jgi:hypothetical protein
VKQEQQQQQRERENRNKEPCVRDKLLIALKCLMKSLIKIRKMHDLICCNMHKSQDSRVTTSLLANFSPGLSFPHTQIKLIVSNAIVRHQLMAEWDENYSLK